MPDGRPPADTDGARAWLHASPRVLLDAVSAIDPEENVATFLGPRPAGWWVRRRLHEATVHRAEDLFLALVRRRTHQEPGIEIDGDMQVWHTWLARTPL